MTEQEWLASDDPTRMLAYMTLDQTSSRWRHIGDRQLRLFACACCRQPEVWEQLVDDTPCQRCNGEFKTVKCPWCSGTGRINRSRRAVEVTERYADGLVMEEELYDSDIAAGTVGYTSVPALSWLVRRCCWHHARSGAEEMVEGLMRHKLVPPTTQAALLRCIGGNPWRAVTLPKIKRCKKCGWDGLGPNRKYCDRPQTFDGKVPHLWTEYCPWLAHADGAVHKIAQVIYDERRFELMPMLADALEEAGCTEDVILAHLRGPGPHARGCRVLDLLLGRD